MKSETLDFFCRIDILDGNLEVGVSYDDPDATFLTGQGCIMFQSI